LGSSDLGSSCEIFIYNDRFEISLSIWRWIQMFVYLVWHWSWILNLQKEIYWWRRLLSIMWTSINEHTFAAVQFHGSLLLWECKEQYILLYKTLDHEKEPPCFALKKEKKGSMSLFFYNPLYTPFLFKRKYSNMSWKSIDWIL
jgi:hypothetical protein